MSVGDKFGRNYRLVVQGSDNQEINIALPFTLEFDITRHTLASANVAQIRIYNLSKINRSLIAYNAFNVKQLRTVKLYAGYGDSLALIFNGNITQAWSIREGVNYITQIECYDGGYASVNSDLNITFPAGTPLKVALTQIMTNLPGVDFGAVGNFDGIFAQAKTFSGNAIEILNQLTGNAFFIDNGKAYALKNDEYIQQLAPVVIVNPSTGLLNTPVLEQTVIRFEMLFEPNLNTGNLAFLTSETNPILTGIYKITAVKHRGTISPVVCGNLTTTGEFVNNKENIPVLGT